MAIQAGRVPVWVGSIEDRVGGAARLLEPLAAAGVGLDFVVARRTPEDPGRGILFAAPVRGRKAEQAAAAAGMRPARDIAALLVQGDDRPGLGHAIAAAIGGAGVSFRGLSAAVVGRRFACYVSFDGPGDADRAARAIRAIGRS